MMNDYKVNKLLSDTITLPILPANKFTNTDTEYYAVLEKNYIPIESTITCIYKPDWITGYNFTTKDKYYNRLSITSINDNTEKKLRKGIMEFVCTNNISNTSTFIFGINHIYAKVSQAPYEEVDVRLEFIATKDLTGLTDKEKWDDKTEHIIGGKISGDEQELHIKYYGILNGINLSNVTLLINDKQLDTNNIKSLRTTVLNEIDLIYLIDENINTADKKLKFTVIFKTTYNSKLKDYYITQGYNNYVLKLGIDSINNITADNILYQGEEKKLIYTFSLNGEYKQSDDLEVYFEFINNTYELNYQTGITSYIDNQYNLNLTINPNYTLLKRKVKVYVIYKNKIKSNEIILILTYDTNMRLYYEIDSITYDSVSTFKVTPFGKDISLYYYVRTTDGHIITSMSNIKYIDNIEITEYFEINYTRTNKNLTDNNIKVIDNDVNDTKKLLYLLFPLLTEFINPEICISISLSTLKLNNITFIQQNFTQTKVNINKKLSTETIGGIPLFSEIKIVFNAVNVYENENENEKSIVIDSNLFNINFYQKNQDVYTLANSMFDLDNIEYENTKDTDDYLIAQNIRLKNEYYNALGNRDFYYQISYILGNTEIHRTDYIKITLESLLYECKLVSDTNIISFEGNNNFIVKGYGILYNNQEEKNKGTSSTAYYTTYLTSTTIDENSDKILNSQMKLIKASDYTNIKLDIKNIDNTNVNNNQKIQKLIIRGKYRYNTNSNIAEDVLTLYQTYIKLNLELYSNSSLDNLLTYNNSTNDSDCYIIENILQDTVLYFKYYMQESIIENRNVKLVNVDLKNYNSNLTINLNNLTVWTQNNLMPYTSNIIYNEDENYYYGILNIPLNLLTRDNKIILKYIQNYKDIDYAYTLFVLYKDRVDTLYDDDTVYGDNHDEYAYISHYRITGVDGITISSVIDFGLLSTVQYKIDTTKVTELIIYYNVIYKYRDKTLIDTTLNNFYKGTSSISSYTPYYEKSEQLIEEKGGYNYIGQKITMLENVNNDELAYIYSIKYKNNYKKNNINRRILLIQKSATRAYNLSSLIDDQYDQDDKNKILIYGVRHKDKDDKFLLIPNYSIYCDPLAQTLTLYIGLYCNNHVDKDYKLPFETGKIEGTDIKITKDMFNLSEDDKKYVSITDPVYNNDVSNGYYEFNVTLSDITLQTENTSIELKYSRNYKTYNYNYNVTSANYKREVYRYSNILKIVRLAYNTKNYTVYIGFHTLNSLTDSDGKSTKIDNNVSKDENELYVLFYLIKNGDSTKLDLTKIAYDFTLTLNNEDIEIDFSQISKNDDNVYSYFYTLPNNISELSRDLNAMIKINSNLKLSAKITLYASEYNVIIRDRADFKNGNQLITKENGKLIDISLYFKGGPTDGSFDDELSHYNIICSDINIALGAIEKYNNTCFKVNVNIPENDSITDSKSYEIKVLYQSNNLADVHEDTCTINLKNSVIKAFLNIDGHTDNDKINITGETLTLECYGTLNDDEKAEGVLICSDSSITIPKPAKQVNSNKLIYKIEIPISTTTRELTFTFTYTFNENKVSTSKKLLQESGKFTLYIFAYYNDKEDNEQLDLDSSANGQFTIRYYSQYENGNTDTKNIDSYILSYDKFTDEELNTYEYLKDFSLQTEKQLNKKTDIITSIDSSGNKYEIKKPDITGIENTYNFSKNDDDEEESTDKAIKFTVTYRDETASVIVHLQSSLTTNLDKFDYLIFHYILDSSNSAKEERNNGDNTITDGDIKISRNNGAGTDMDTVTRITNNKNIKLELKGDLDSSFILNNTTIGYGLIVTTGSYDNVTNYSSFFKMSNDNTTTTGEESVFINVRKIINKITTLYPDIVKKCRYLYFDLFGHWYNTMNTGKVQITYETYTAANVDNPLIKLDNKYVIKSLSPDSKANDSININAYIYTESSKSAYNTLMARLTYDLKKGTTNLTSMSIPGYYLSKNSDGVLVANRVVTNNPNVVYINTLYLLQYNNDINDINITTKTILKSQISSTSIELFDFSTYYYSLIIINNNTWRVWKYFKNFWIKTPDNQGLYFNTSDKKIYLNAKSSYSSMTWPTANDNTRTITVTSEPEIPGFSFNIKIIEQKSN